MANQLAAIDHLVVLMLENRSLDHMLGYLYSDSHNVSPTGQPFDGLTGTESCPGADGKPVSVFPITASTPNAYFMPGADPGEGYAATNNQLYGSTTAPPHGATAPMQGFVTDYVTAIATNKKRKWYVVPGTVPEWIMGCYTPEALPVLSALAKGYAVSDRWFCSAPTMTMPNRAFVCAGTSQGHLDDVTKVFTAPSIFGALSGAGVTWKIYGYNAQPLTKLDFPDTSQASADHFGRFPDFKADATAGRLPAYSFLEPSWSSTGNSQHPNYNVALGEQLLLDTYRALRSGPGWDSTLLIITYDEHGGCYDHVSPPWGATPPDASVGEFGFDFTRFGVRVPTVLVSPLIAAGTVLCSGTDVPFDHTSILATVERRWGITALTARDAAAPDVGPVLTLPTARTDDPLADVSPPAPPKIPAALAQQVSHLQLVQAELAAYASGEPQPPVLATNSEAQAYIDAASEPLKAPADSIDPTHLYPDPAHTSGGTMPADDKKPSATPSQPGAVEARRTLLPGSEREAIGAETVAAAAPVDPETQIEVTIVLRRRQPLPEEGDLSTPLTSAELAARYGAAPHDLATVEHVLAGADVQVVALDAAARTVRARGSVSALSALFGTSLQQAHGPSGKFRTRTGTLSVPAALDGIVTAVLGLDNRPAARTRHVVAAKASAAKSYTPPQLAKIYGMPDADGTGQTIAIIELGGGFAQSDLVAYFGQLSLPVPTVSAVGVDGATNTPGQDPTGADGEVLLDIEVAGGIAPAAHQVVYFGPNTDAGFLDAVAQAAHATPTPVAISISWGQSEDQWTGQSRTAMDAAFADACALGITVTAAAGDNGSGDSDTSGSGQHVDFPASSPHVLACGGTALTSGGKKPTETVWNDGGTGGATGGGVSDVFPLPNWQQGVGVPAAPSAAGGRGVPDVAGDADPETGYKVHVDGKDMVYGGTSAVAPLWAGLLARLAQKTGTRAGLAQPLLYQGAKVGKTSPGFRDITSGNNGAFSAGPGWDACTGLGVPSSKLLKVFTPNGGKHHKRS